MACAAFSASSSAMWSSCRLGVAESEMLTHGVGLECMHPQPGKSDLHPDVLINPSHSPHKYTRMFENLYCFSYAARIGIIELAFARKY
jgi:hypothetical protein